jgi:hypothetical protein
MGVAAQATRALIGRPRNNLASRTLWRLRHNTAAALVVIVSPSQRQSAEMLRTVRMLYGKLDGAASLDTESVLKIEFQNKSRILALPGTSDTIRGLAGAALVVLDEASRVPDELLAAVRPMVATSNGSIIALTTPAGRRGFFFDAWHSGDPRPCSPRPLRRFWAGHRFYKSHGPRSNDGSGITRDRIASLFSLGDPLRSGYAKRAVCCGGPRHGPLSRSSRSCGWRLARVSPETFS